MVVTGVTFHVADGKARVAGVAFRAAATTRRGECDVG